MAELLLAGGADVNVKDDGGDTPLHAGAYEGDKDVAALLLARGADINAKDKKGATPLHLMASQGHEEIVELLLGGGANASAKDEYEGRGGFQAGLLRRLLAFVVPHRGLLAVSLLLFLPVAAVQLLQPYVLKQAIERLRPVGQRQMTAPEWILYNILELKFLQGRRVREIALRLAMSESDLYRKQRIAIEAVAQTLAEMEQELNDQETTSEKT